MIPLRKIKLLFLLFVLILSSGKSLKAQLHVPIGFIDTVYSQGWQSVVGFEFDKNGQQYVWEKKGRVWIVDTNNVRLPLPLLDINEEVGVFGDNGLTGFCLDPDFLNNGYYYTFYTVDRYYLLNYGTPQYDSLISWPNEATICRVTRFQADSATNFHTTVPGSKFILLGEDKKHGVPVLYPAHTGGTLLFGRDSTLIVSTSDGASYGDLDTGSVNSTYWLQAINDSIIPATHNVGSFRSLLKGSLNGKLLRINRMTGDGIKSNPFYDSTDVRSPQSRTYASGFRNPYRITIIPNTGSTDVTACDPGILMVGDVGWNTYEELDIVKGPGGNYGWPIFEGLNRENKYSVSNIEDIEAPNPLYNGITCNKPYFYFSDILKQETFNGIVSFPNSCDSNSQIPTALTAVHARPKMDWRHGQKITRIPSFQGNVATAIQITNSNSTVTGDMFAGNASLGGIYYTGNSFPFEYKNTYFHCDYGAGWINNFKLDANYEITNVSPFDTALGFGKIVFLTQNPRNGCLMYISYTDTIRQVCYTGQVNYPPQAIITQDTTYGPSPLTVNFDGSSSTDPENQPLTYFWDFGDGTTSTLANPNHSFSAFTGVPTTYTVSLTVTDDSSYTSTAISKVFVNNTPPIATISSIPLGTQYSVTLETILPLQAIVSDAESANSLLTYEWVTTLYHESHTHPGTIDNDSSTYTILSPTPCGNEVYFYKISLKVIDPEGLSTTDHIDVYPNCNANINDFSNNNSNGLSLIVVPNPVFSEATLTLFSKDKINSNIAEVNIYSADSRLVYNNKYQINQPFNKIDLPVDLKSNLVKGIYYVNVTVAGKKAYSKLVKQ